MTVGVDLVAVCRLRRMLEEVPGALERVFTERELRRCAGPRAAERLAARYAAKEAVLKAIGTGISGRLALIDVEIIREPSGRPVVLLHAAAAEHATRQGIESVAVSMSHSEGMALACAVAT